MKKILPLFSYLFHPLLTPLFAVMSYIFVVENYLSTAEKLLVTIQIFIILLLIPLAFFFLLRSLGKIDTVMAYDVNQRKLPLIMQAILIYVLIRQSVLLERIVPLKFFFIGAFVATMLSLILVFCKVKASLHMVGMASLAFFIISVSYASRENHVVYIAILFVLTGIVATSRLYMNAHSNKELVYGFLIGMLSQMAFWYFWL